MNVVKNINAAYSFVCFVQLGRADSQLFFGGGILNKPHAGSRPITHNACAGTVTEIDGQNLIKASKTAWVRAGSDVREKPSGCQCQCRRRAEEAPSAAR